LTVLKLSATHKTRSPSINQVFSLSRDVEQLTCDFFGLYSLHDEVTTMALTISTETIPLMTNADGVIRVGKTRVTLDTVIAAFQDGATAEEITQQYPSLDLADVYSVIAYYLRRRTEVEAYQRQRQTQAEKVRKENEARFDPSGIRDRLIARQASRSS
jgi:uncharacterized protein (DUF433 family)